MHARTAISGRGNESNVPLKLLELKKSLLLIGKNDPIMQISTWPSFSPARTTDLSPIIGALETCPPTVGAAPLETGAPQPCDRPPPSLLLRPRWRQLWQTLSRRTTPLWLLWSKASCKSRFCAFDACMGCSQCSAVIIGSTVFIPLLCRAVL